MNRILRSLTLFVAFALTLVLATGAARTEAEEPPPRAERPALDLVGSPLDEAEAPAHGQSADPAAAPPAARYDERRCIHWARDRFADLWRATLDDVWSIWLRTRELFFDLD